LRRLVGLCIHQRKVFFRHAGALQAVEQQKMLDQTGFDADLFALEIFEGLDAGFADDHVVAVGIVGQHDHDAFAAAGAGDERIPIGDQIRVDFSGRVGVHRRRVVEPLKCHINAGRLEPTLVDGDLPGDPPWPITVADRQPRRRCWLRDSQNT
jgi:hypothetical protein